jgi:hypothetical protein
MGHVPFSLPALVPEKSPLSCLLKQWKDLDPNNLKKKTLIFRYTEAWAKYPLGDQERWPPEVSTHYNTILQLDLFCRREEKWTKIPHTLLFFSFQDHPEWLSKCYLDTQAMAMVCSLQPPKETQGQKPLQTPQSQNVESKDPPQLAATDSRLLTSYPGPTYGCYSL